MLIDLHTHSAVSDGTQAPGELVAEAAQLGIDVIALTDHDTTAGWEGALSAAENLGITVVPGIEISCSAGGVSLHLLGYGIDPTYEPLAAELEHARVSRATRLERIVQRLARDLPVTLEDVQAQVGAGATPGRPHIADALVARGIVPTRDAAFARYLHNDSPYYVSHYAPDPVDAVSLVVAAGGVAVMAHPFAMKRGLVVDDEVIADMADAGLAGLEMDHPDHDGEARAHARDLAAQLDLVTTGSSDYHGAGKTNRLAQCTTTPEAYERLLGGRYPAGSLVPAAGGPRR